MAIAYVNSALGTFTDGPASSYAFPATSLTAGNLIVVGLRATRGSSIISSISDTAGNTYSQAGAGTQDAGGGTQLELWYAKNVSGNASNIVTVTLAASIQFIAGVTGQYSGIDTSSPLDTSAVGSANPSFSVTSASFTTAQADELIVSFSQVAATGGTWTAGSGYTGRGSDNQKVTFLQDKIVSAIQTGVTTSASQTSNSPISIQVATFKAAGGAASVGPLTGGGVLAHGRLINGGRLVRAPSMWLPERFVA